jgi:hypothetical protein
VNHVSFNRIRSLLPEHSQLSASVQQALPEETKLKEMLSQVESWQQKTRKILSVQVVMNAMSDTLSL